jgi:3-phenylpropionate/cinnamic acid dioxygenase small subunit
MGGVSDEADRIRIHELISWHGHLMDEGEFDRLDELFTEDVVYDVSAFGSGRLDGWQAVADAARALGAANPLGHHVTNIVVLSIDGDQARVRSKGLAVMSDGSAGSVVYEDQVRRTGSGWRIAERRVLPRKAPLRPTGSVLRPLQNEQLGLARAQRDGDAAEAARCSGPHVAAGGVRRAEAERGKLEVPGAGLRAQVGQQYRLAAAGAGLDHRLDLPADE